jgi:membrane associated rhomboid family serine protease
MRLRSGGFGSIPPVVKNLLILNGLFFLATITLTDKINLTSILGLFYVGSNQFQPYQFITHMFMHGSIGHIFFNMFSLWMFGKVLESYWGAKKFFAYYFITGIGAALIHVLVNYIRLQMLTPGVPADVLQDIVNNGYGIIQQSKNYADPTLGEINYLFNIPTVGASGAIFGLLMAFGMLFPNAQLMLLIPPIPIKAKYIAVIALFAGVLFDRQGNVAHFAHLGGMIFGFILIKIWKKKDINDRWT